MHNKFFSLSMLALLLAGSVTAQEAETNTLKKNKKEENIIIKKKGDKTEKVTVVVDGEKVTVNGVPIDEFNDENVEIVRGKAKGLKADMSALRTLAQNAEGFTFNRNGFTAVGNKAFLGVTTEKVDEGAKITTVAKESAAEKAGLQIGDIITKVGDKKIANSNDLHSAIAKFKPEEKVMVTYLRSGKEATTQAILGKNKSAISMSFNSEGFDMQLPEGGMNFFNSFPRKPKLGLQIEDIEEGNGVKILEVEQNTPAEKAGLKQDDIILELDGKELKNVDELRNRMKDFKEGDLIKVKYKRGNKTQTVDVKMPKTLKKATL